MTSVLLTRDDGVAFALDGTTLGLTALQGVDAPAVELFTAKRAVGSGDVVTGHRLASRLITLRARARHCTDNPVLRTFVSSFLRPAFTYLVRVTYLDVTRVARDCRLKAFSMPTGNLYEPLSLQVSLLCPYAYLEAETAPSVQLHTQAALCSSLTPHVPTCMGCQLPNLGHVPTPLRLTLTVGGDQPVVNPAVVCNSGHVRVLTTLAPSDRLVVDAEERMVWLNNGSALHLMDLHSSPAKLTLPCVGGLVGYHAEENLEQLQVRADYRVRYLGM